MKWDREELEGILQKAADGPVEVECVNRQAARNVRFRLLDITRKEGKPPIRVSLEGRVLTVRRKEVGDSMIVAIREKGEGR